jgi:hypothetical protein
VGGFGKRLTPEFIENRIARPPQSVATITFLDR